jgi:putative glycosyltransferase (TIGR04372 family)
MARGLRSWLQERRWLWAMLCYVRVVLFPNSPSSWLNWARSLRLRGKLDQADNAMRKVLALAPDNAVFHLEMAVCQRVRKNLKEMEACVQNASRCSIANLSPNERADFYTLILQCAFFASKADGDEGATHYWKIACSNFPDEKDRIVLFERMADTAMGRGCYDLAAECALENRKAQDALHVRLTGQPAGKRYLRERWCNQIGHLSHLDTYVKIGKLGWRPEPESVLLAPPGKIANPYFLNLWKQHLTVVTEPNEVARLQDRAMAAEDYLTFSYIRGKPMYTVMAAPVAQQQWERENRPSLLKLDDATLNRGWEQLHRLGMRPGDWFVGLHVREPGFYGKEDNRCQYHRNARVASYALAMQEITRRGGWVIRMGDPSMTPLAPMGRVLDYARSSWRSDWMDIFLCSQSRFFVGVQSGVSFVANVFGVPTVWTNWVSLGIPPWYRSDLFILKKMLLRNENRLLSFEEMFTTKLAMAAYSLCFEDRGVELIDNSPEEIRDVVVEMMDRAENRPIGTCEALQDQWIQLAQSYGAIVNTRMGRKYLETHADLVKSRQLQTRKAS